MSGIVWLASYPKSGNTWTRALIVNALRGRDEPVPINALATGGIASGRQVFDELTLLASSLLTHDEADRLRPAVHRAHALSHAAAEMRDDRAEDLETARLAARFVKVHDAWTLNDRGEPVLGGARAAQIAVLIVRDPRAVAPSLANHLGCSIDEAIERMGDPSYVFSGGGRKRPASQLRQTLLDWSGHAASWLDQRDVPVRLIRYEDLHADTVGVLVSALAATGHTLSRERAEAACAAARFDRLTAQEAETGFREAPKGRRFFRRGETEAWREELTPEQIARIERDHAPMMVRLGYAPVTAAPRKTEEKT